MAKSIIIGIAFSLLYVSLYPVVRGQFVIHLYPPLSVPQATAYVLGGILLQAWFCMFRSRLASWRWFLGQILTGLLYAAAIAAFPGGIYQT